MSEVLHPTHETAEKLDLHEQTAENLDKIKAKAEASPEHTDDALETLRHNIETQAFSSKEVAVGEKQESSNASHSFAAHKQLKVDAYKRGLKHIQSRLHGPDRVFSKVVHQDKIDKLSGLAGQTVARPSGILAGGLCALIGSSIALYMARHYGFRYNFSVFIVLFIGGYFLGLLLELTGRLVKRRS